MLDKSNTLLERSIIDPLLLIKFPFQYKLVPFLYNLKEISLGGLAPENIIPFVSAISIFILLSTTSLEESILKTELLLEFKKLKNPASESPVSPDLNTKPSPVSSHLIFPSFTSPPKIRGVDTKVPNVGFKLTTLSENWIELFPL